MKPQLESPPSATGRQYWRSLDEVAESPEFRQWVEREFPQGASEWADPVSRRHFVRIMSASFLLAGLGLAGSGCRRPLENLEPLGKQPDDYVYGTSRWYATAMPTRSGAIPLIAKSYEGRPVKLEGNAQYPGANGGTDRWTQASILSLYDPDRSRRFTRGGTDARPAEVLDFLDGLSRRAQANGGEGLSFLLEPGTSPSRHRLQDLIRRKFPKARWHEYEPIDLDADRHAASEAFGAPMRPVYHYDDARVIVSLDCDFIGSEDDAHNNIRRFSEGRRIEKPTDSINRLYVAESLLTLTGMLADHRLRISPGAVAGICSGLYGAIRGQEPGAGANAKWISECAKDLLQHRGESLVVAGYRQPAAVHVLAHAMNAALGNIGKTVRFLEAPAATENTLAELARSLMAGQVDTLVILGGNPAYSAPVSLDWASAQNKARSVVRLGYSEDETFEISKRADDWHLPLAHYLESWGDAVTRDGLLVPVQPLISPLFGGLTELEILARIAGEPVNQPYAVVRQTFGSMAPPAPLAGQPEFEEQWRKFLYNGFWETPALKPAEPRLNSAAVEAALKGIETPAAPGRENLEVVFYRDYKLDDGRHSNNGWLQELPDPVTKITWDNAVILSRRTALDLGLKNFDTVEVRLGNGKVAGPVWIQPGMADNTAGLALGYGRWKAGRVGSGVGFNAAVLRSGSKFFAGGGTIRPLGGTFELSCTQHHWSMEGRPIIREANLEEFRQHPNFANREKLEEPKVVAPLYPNPFDKFKEAGLHQWGMAIDLNRCVGCNACVIACQSENNIPIVGKDQVRRGREMHWMRIDRYYAADPGKGRLPDVGNPDHREEFEPWIDDPQSVVQPMLCQHCEAAPCENVCPVNATTHDNEGLNLMVYNRCVGTRYCSNNCPYKVRRFNFLDFNKRSLKNLNGPLYPTPMLPHDGKWELLTWWKDPTDPTAGMRPDDEWDLIKMSKNPDVTVRMRGVMEKCTLCVQRIEHAKIAQKVKAGASGDVKLRESEGTVPKTACQQACPAGAIVFGDISDPSSSVSRLKAQERNYTVLDNLFTRPRTTYLARVRNPNPAMPDYRAIPASLEEFELKQGEPIEESGEGRAASGEERRHG